MTEVQAWKQQALPLNEEFSGEAFCFLKRLSSGRMNCWRSPS